MRETRLFADNDLSDDVLREMKNVPIVIRFRDGSPDQELLGFDWAIGPDGSLVVHRLILLDEDHPQAFMARQCAAGTWLDVHRGGVTYDLEAIKKQEDEARQQEAAGVLGVAAGNGRPGPSRAMRRG